MEIFLVKFYSDFSFAPADSSDEVTTDKRNMTLLKWLFYKLFARNMVLFQNVCLISLYRLFETAPPVITHIEF